MKTALFILFISYLLNAVSFAKADKLGRSPLPVTWTMVNVNASFLQGDAHWLEMPDGKRILIDACGNNEALLAFLKKKQIQYIDQVLISHMHKDHYGGLLQLVSSGIRVGEIRLTVPSERTCKAEIPWGCDWNDIQAFLRKTKELRIPVKGYRLNERLYEFKETRLEVIAAYPSFPTPVGEVDVNDTSAILKLTNGNMRALFTGDLNTKLGQWLSESAAPLEADILKVPHHGTESAAPNTFFDRVGAKFALVPSPATLWLSQRSARIRNYLAGKGTTAFVNGMGGDIIVTLNRHSFTIDPEHERPQKAVYFPKQLSE